MKFYSKYLPLFFFILLLSACKKLTEGHNINPNTPSDAPYTLQLNGTEVASILVYEGNLARVTGIFSGSFTGADRQYISLQNYTTSAPDYDDAWDNLYATVITQAQTVKAKAQAVNDRLTVGIAQVLEAQGFGFAADLWGDVPFSQVGDPSAYPTPAFDAQADVYAGVQVLLDSALDNLASGVGNGPGTKDFFGGGDPDTWTKIANTLKARFFLHTKDYVNAITYASAGIDDAAGNMMAPHGNTYLSDFNIYYSFLTYDRVGYMTADGAPAPGLLDAASDTYHGNTKTDETARYNYLYQEGLNTGGLDPNVLCDFDWGNASNENGFFGGNTAFPLVTYEENQLILAEAYAKSSQTANALAALNAYRDYLNGGGYINSGYKSSGLKYLAYATADFNAGGIANPATSGLTADQALLKEILTERYLTFIGQIEQFNDIRRTKNYIGITPNTGNKFPQRILYSQTEINTNPNTPALSASDLYTETPVNTSAY